MVNAIRQARDARGWTSARLNLELRRAGSRSGVATASESSLRVMISQWENGRQVPSPAYRALLGKVLGLSADAVAHNDPSEHAGAPLPMLPSRRGAGLEVSDSVLSYFRRQLTEHVQLDNAAGPGLILDVVSTQVTQLRQIAERGPSEVVVTLAARFLEHAGWLHQDSGNLDKALRYTDESVDLAERAGDTALTAYNTMRKSNVLTDRGELQRAKVTAERAAGLAARLAPDQEAICLRQVALAAAHLQDEAAARSAVDRALELTDGSGAVSRYSEYCTTSYLEMEGAVCLLVLGQPAAAVDACTRALTSWPDGRVRDEGLCLSRLALAQLDQHQVDEACAAALLAIERIQEAPSARALQVLRTVGRRVTPFRQAASVRQLRQALATVA